MEIQEIRNATLKIQYGSRMILLDPWFQDQGTGFSAKALKPDLFACLNAKKIFNDWNASHYYDRSTAENGKASDCIRCGKCERVCPQHLPIRDLLKDVAEAFG